MFQQATRAALRTKRLNPLVADMESADNNGTALRLPGWRVL